MNTKLRVAAYCRVSKDIKEQETSFITQTTTYDRIISMHPEWELIKIYADKGKTGTSTKKRFEFNQMIEDAKSGKIDLILVKSVSRFSRNTVDLLETIRVLRQNGVGVYFEKENINTLNLNSELLIARLVVSALVMRLLSRVIPALLWPIPSFILVPSQSMWISTFPPTT